MQWLVGGPAGLRTGRDDGPGEPVAAVVERDTPCRRRWSPCRVLSFARTWRACPDLAARRVALGECDAAVGFGPAESDVAAGEAIVLAAGGSVRPLDSALDLPALVSAAPGLAAALAEPTRWPS